MKTPKGLALRPYSNGKYEVYIDVPIPSNPKRTKQITIGSFPYETALRKRKFAEERREEMKKMMRRGACSLVPEKAFFLEVASSVAEECVPSQDTAPPPPPPPSHGVETEKKCTLVIRKADSAPCDIPVNTALEAVMKVSRQMSGVKMYTFSLPLLGRFVMLQDGEFQMR